MAWNPIVSNPWASALDVKTLSELRDGSVQMAQEVFRGIRESHPEKVLSHQEQALYRDVIFAACCRAQVLDGTDGSSTARFPEHLRFVEKATQDAAINAAMRTKGNF